MIKQLKVTYNIGGKLIELYRIVDVIDFELPDFDNYVPQGGD